MKTLLLGLLKFLVPIYLIVCGLVYYFQEKLIFFPEQLPSDFEFGFDGDFEEIWIPTHDQITLHGLLFKTKDPKGLVFYLHGNAGSLRSWGEVASVFTDLEQDVFLLDYRGYGKSEGKIKSETQLFSDTQQAYDWAKALYGEENITVLGYSIGTGMATQLAAGNQPNMLILQAPFFNLNSLVRKHFPIFPAFLLRYPFENHRYLKAIRSPVVLFHGREDDIIPMEATMQLNEIGENVEDLILLDNQGHNGMTYHPIYLQKIKEIFSD
ncbi:alpha/beta hydrolase [Pararhodonellum marinum]|uniref:alpha/beta hydrolase n=1 Tax=Pararhodonellum marinum TaxID=2755358 RepID=UPI00188DDA30|nr:alpha/beta fold hydrolase [Pararhodonellum marinum]